MTQVFRQFFIYELQPLGEKKNHPSVSDCWEGLNESTGALQQGHGEQPPLALTLLCAPPPVLCLQVREARVPGWERVPPFHSRKQGALGSAFQRVGKPTAAGTRNCAV